MIRAGTLDRRIAILRHGPAADDGSTMTPGELAPIAWRRASVKPARGSEALAQDGIEARRVMSVRMRSDEVTRAISETDKLLFDGAVWDIVAPPVPIGRREAIEIFVTAGDGAADVSGIVP